MQGNVAGVAWGMMVAAGTVCMARAGGSPMPPGTIGELVEHRTAPPVVRLVTPTPDSLNLRGRGLSALPPEAASLTAIRALYLDGNAFEAPPAGLDAFPDLERLSLEANRLATLVGLGPLPKLERLNAAHNRITALGPELAGLPALRVLDLRANGLTALPPAIGQLVHLEFLMLDDNALAALPDEIGNCTSLHRLMLSGNRLTTLPPGMKQLVMLETLDLGQNRLTALPPALDACVSLRLLILTGNPIPKADKNRFRRAVPGCMVME